MIFSRYRFFQLMEKNSVSHTRFPVSQHPIPIPVFPSMPSFILVKTWYTCSSGASDKLRCSQDQIVIVILCMIIVMIPREDRSLSHAPYTSGMQRYHYNKKKNLFVSYARGKTVLVRY